MNEPTQLVLLTRPPPEAQPEIHLATVPPRVCVAMGFLDRLTAKTARTPLANDVGFEVVDGQELSIEERKTQVAALDLLGAYFRGDLRPSPWDRPPKRPQTRARDSESAPYLKLQCPSCQRAPYKQSSCEVCGGVGYVRVARCES